MADEGKRFQLIDLDDYTSYGATSDTLTFWPYRVGATVYGRANPTEYTPHEREEPVKSKIAINGYRISMRFPLAPEKRKLSWTRIEKIFYDELKKRSDSGHRFVLRDQDGQLLTGRIVEFAFDAIVSTVPTAYKGGFSFEGIGKWRNPLA